MSNVVIRGANELTWSRGSQIGVTLHAWRVVGCFRFFSCFFWHFYFSSNNNGKCEFTIPASEVVQFFNNSDVNFRFLVAKFVWFTFERRRFFFFFQNGRKKNLATKKLKLPSKLLDNFASFHVAVFKLQQVSLFSSW